GNEALTTKRPAGCAVCRRRRTADQSVLAILQGQAHCGEPTMSSTRPFAVGEASARYGWLVLGLLVWVLACGVLRFFFLEDERWLGWCAEAPSSLACRARGWLGWAIHLRVLAWLALPPALLGFCLPG